MRNLIETFRQIGNLSLENEKDLLNAIERIEYGPKSILQKEGDVCNKIFFVEKGTARTFYYKNGKDITHWIAVENEFVGSMSSFFMRKPSTKMVETIESCVLYVFDHQELENLIHSNPDFERIGRLFAYYGLDQLEERFDNLHFYTAKERFEILLKRQPEIVRRVPLGIIASYLGITQETLSRIRSQK